MEILSAAVAYLDDAEEVDRQAEYNVAVIFRVLPGDRVPFTEYGRSYLLPRWEIVGTRLCYTTGAYVDRAPLPAGAYYATHAELGVPWQLAHDLFTLRRTFTLERTAGASRLRAMYFAHQINQMTQCVNRSMYVQLRKAHTRRQHALRAWACGFGAPVA